jgi:hypothetical protein
MNLLPFLLVGAVLAIATSADAPWNRSGASDGQEGFKPGDTVTGADGNEYVCTRAESADGAANTNAALWTRKDGTTGIFLMNLAPAGVAPFFTRFAFQD